METIYIPVSNKTLARRVISKLRNFGILSSYVSGSKSLRVFVTNFGEEATRKQVEGIIASIK